jgi:hypothetical protein
MGGQAPGDLHQRLVDPQLRLVAKGPGFGPPGCDADQIERLAELTSGVATVVGDQVDLAEPRSPIVPLAEGADRDLALQDRPGLGPGASAHPQAGPLGCQQAIDARGRDPKKLAPDLGGASELPGRSRAWRASAINGARRLPAGRPSAAHTNRSGSTMSSP